MMSVCPNLRLDFHIKACIWWMKRNEASCSLAVCLPAFSSELQRNHCDSLELPQIWSADEWFMLCSLIQNWGRVFFITYCIIAFCVFFFSGLDAWQASLTPFLHHSYPPSLICSSAATPNILSLHPPPLPNTLSLSLHPLFILIILIFSHKADTRLWISSSYLPLTKERKEYMYWKFGRRLLQVLTLTSKY